MSKRSSENWPTSSRFAPSAFQSGDSVPKDLLATYVACFLLNPKHVLVAKYVA